jgi:hypothetical protein
MTVIGFAALTPADRLAAADLVVDDAEELQVALSSATSHQR